MLDKLIQYAIIPNSSSLTLNPRIPVFLQIVLAIVIMLFAFRFLCGEKASNTVVVNGWKALRYIGTRVWNFLVWLAPHVWNAIVNFVRWATPRLWNATVRFTQ